MCGVGVLSQIAAEFDRDCGRPSIYGAVRGRLRGGAAIGPAVWAIWPRSYEGSESCFVAVLCAKDTFFSRSQINYLEEDENDGSLANGGDSDPAETTVGKLSIS